MASGNRQSTVVAKLLPRVRGIRGIPGMPSHILGTTSAHAENTCAGEVFSLADENYLRVRGEYDDGLPNITAGQELPPRTRRIRAVWPRLLPPRGTTSAYAENTTATSKPQGLYGNYLRVRGEYSAYT